MAEPQNSANSFPTWGIDFHKYLKAVGEGAFGKVFKAQGIHDRETYAVKQISVQKFQLHHSKSGKDINTWKDSLLQEVDFLTTLDSEFVIRYYTCGFHGPNSQTYVNQPENSISSISSNYITTDWFFIKMSFCEEDLRKWIDAKNLDEREPHKVSIINQILNGLQYIHGQKVIHRDIKPANIMLKKVLHSENINSFQVKIGDFGLSKLVHSDSLGSGHVGTHIYMSPEMKLGRKYSYQTDIYSAGLVIFEIVNPSLSHAQRDYIFNKFISEGFVIVFPTTGDSQNEIELIKSMANMNENRRLQASELLQKYAPHHHFKIADDKKMAFPSSNLNGDNKVSLSDSTNSNTVGLLEGTSGVYNFKTIQVNLDWPITHGVHLPIESFKGRKQELTQLQSCLNNDKRLVLICGFGGIGKTELSRKFLKKTVKHQNDSSSRMLLNNIFRSSSEDSKSITNRVSRVWLHGDTIESFKNSIFSFANQLGVENKTATPSQMFKYLTEMTLKYSQKLIVVIDNVDTKIEEITECLKFVRIYENIFIIVTSRNKMILDNAGKTILLDVLSHADVKKILRNNIENISNSDVDLFCKLVQNYPLAIQQAVAYIKEQRNDFKTLKYSVSDYVKEFEEKTTEMLGKELNKLEDDYAMTTLATWDITFDKLSEDAIALLKILAFLDPDEVRVQLCKDIWVGFGFKKEFTHAVNILKKYSIIKAEVSSLRLSLFRTHLGEIISIHRLVQEVLRPKVEVVFRKKLFHLILVAVSKGQYNQDHRRIERICFLTYGIELKHDWLKSHAPNELLYSIKSEIALELCIKNKTEDALELWTEVLSSEYNNETYQTGFDAILLISKSNFVLPAQCLENLLESRKSSFGNDHKITTMFKVVLAATLENNGESERCLELFREIKSYYETNEPLSDFYTKLFLLSNVQRLRRPDIQRLFSSFNYRRLDLESLERLLPIYKKILRENCSLILELENALATEYYKNYEYDKSLALLKQVISSKGLEEIKNRSDGIYSEIYAAYGTMHDLGERFYEKGDYIKARDLFERVLQFRLAYGNKLTAIRTKKWLADTIVALGSDLDTAKIYYHEALNYYKNNSLHFCIPEIKKKLELCNLKVL